MRVMRVMRNIAAKEDLHKVIEQFGGADDRYEIVNNRMIPETKSFLRGFFGRRTSFRAQKKKYRVNCQCS